MGSSNLQTTLIWADPCIFVEIWAGSHKGNCSIHSSIGSCTVNTSVTYGTNWWEVSTSACNSLRPETGPHFEKCLWCPEHRYQHLGVICTKNGPSTGFKASPPSCAHLRLQLVGNKICCTHSSILHHQFTRMPRFPPANTSICHQPLDTHCSPPHHTTTPLGTIVAYPRARLWPCCWHIARFLAATRGDTGRILRRWCRRSRLTRWRCDSNSAWWTGIALVLPCPRSAAFGITRKGGKRKKKIYLTFFIW